MGKSKNRWYNVLANGELWTAVLALLTALISLLKE
jgi:hypothetical protein